MDYKIYTKKAPDSEPLLTICNFYTFAIMLRIISTHPAILERLRQCFLCQQWH